MSTEVIEISEPSIGMRRVQSALPTQVDGVDIGESASRSGSMLNISSLSRRDSGGFKSGLKLSLPSVNVNQTNIIGGRKNSALSSLRFKRAKSLLDTPDTPLTPNSPRGDLNSELTDDYSDDRSEYYDPQTEFDEITERYIIDDEADALLEDQQEMAAELMFEEKEDISSQQKRLAQEFLRDEYHFEQEKTHLKEYLSWKKKAKSKKVVDSCLSRIRDMILHYNQYWSDMTLSLLLYGQTLSLLWILPLRYPSMFLKYSWWIKIFQFDFISYRPEINKYMSIMINDWIGYDYIWFPPFMGLHLFLPLILLIAWYLSPRYGGICCSIFCNEKCCKCICGICCFCCHQNCKTICEDKEGVKGGHKLATRTTNLFDKQWKFVAEKFLFNFLLLLYTPVLVTLLYHGFCLTEGNCLKNCWMLCSSSPNKFWCLTQSIPSIFFGIIYAVAQPILFFKELKRLNVHKINSKHLQYLRNMEVEKGLKISNDYVYQRLHIMSSFSRLGGFFYYLIKYQLRPLILICGAMIFPKMDVDKEKNQNWEMIFAIFTFGIFTFSLIIEIIIRPYRLSTRFIIEIISGITLCISILCCWMKTLDLQNAFLVDNSLFVMMMVIHVVAILIIQFLLLIFLCFKIGRWPINSKVIKDLKERFNHYLKAVEDGKILYIHAISTTPSFVRCDLLFHQRILLQKYHKESILMDNPLSNTLENVILQLESEYYANESMSLMPQRALQEKVGVLRCSLDKRMEEMVLIPQRNRILMLKIMAYNAFRKMSGRESLIKQFDDLEEQKKQKEGEKVIDQLFKIVVTKDDDNEEDNEDNEEEEGEGELDYHIEVEEGSEEEEEGEREDDDGLINFEEEEEEEEEEDRSDDLISKDDDDGLEEVKKDENFELIEINE